MIPPSEITLLWRKHASGLGLLVRVRCSAKADDLVQEAFIRLARQPVVPDDPLSWLARTVRNLAIDTARRDARRQRREQLFCETRFAEASGTGRAPEFAARDVVDSLEHLTPEDRDIVVAHIWNSMTFRQIAEAFSLSSSTVNRRYLCALKQMKTALIKSFEEPQAEKTNHRMSGSGQDG